MELRRLGWAGVEIQAAEQTAVIDLVEDFSWIHGDDPPAGEIPRPPTAGAVAVGLLTHLHSDHADVPALRRALRPGGPVLRPPRAFGDGAEIALVEKAESALADSELTETVLEPWQTIEAGPFEVAALPAADGFGDPQLSWCVTAEGCRVLHAGDTLFHGWWWLAAMRHGPFDVAFLPIGGAIVELESRNPPSPLPAGMDPRQAAVATKLLGARLAVPIHYGPLHESPTHVQTHDPVEAFRRATAELGVEARILEPGGRLTVEPRG